MAVSIESGGGRRKVNAELNLVPFIDLLSVCITFLIATAVWVELSSLPVDQRVGPPGPEQTVTEDLAPLTVHLRTDGAWVGRDAAGGAPVTRVSGSYDWAAVESAIVADRGHLPAERKVVLVADDGVEYRHLVRALDLTRVHGYDQTLLGGSP